MIFDVMTLFPTLIEQITSESIIGRAREKGLIDINCYNIRDYSKDKHKRVDDVPYGGGKGMLISAPPVYDCFEDISQKYETKPYCIYMSPKGELLNHSKVSALSKKRNIAILCGHYEGIDNRVIDMIVDEEISIGDYVLTGGELPACILIDAISRLIPGVLADEECFENESIASGELEYPQFTRPFDFKGIPVPDVLISGNHSDIQRWRKEEALKITEAKRPDLL